MNFIAHLTNGSQFSSKNGYWNDCPDNIQKLEVELPFAIKKIGSGELLRPSTIVIQDYQAYYFANRARTLMSMTGQGTGQTELLGVCFAGFDYGINMVSYYEMSRRGDIVCMRYSQEEFMKRYPININLLKKGI